MVKNKNFKVITVGGATQDIFFHSDAGVMIDNRHDITKQKLVGFEYGAKINIKEADFSFGGGATNSAVCFSKLGAKVSSFLSIGKDKTGESIVNNLEALKVGLPNIHYSSKPSGLSSVIVYGRETHDHVLFTYRGANEDLKIDASDLEKIKSDWIYISSLSGSKWLGVLNKVFAQVVKNNIKIAWNPGNLQIKSGLKELKSFLQNTEVLILNKDEAIELTLEYVDEKIINPRLLLHKLKEFCPHNIVITDGQKGSYAIDINNKIYHEPVKKVEKFDTTGVGDAFGATFVWGLEFLHSDVQAALEVATINAGAVITKQGAQNGLLSKNQMLRKL
jgi:ribokinase